MSRERVEEKRSIEPLEDYVVGAIYDNWKNYTYNQRYLDSLASIFNVHKNSPCAATIFYVSKFFISYNTPFPPEASKLRNKTHNNTSLKINKIIEFIKEANYESVIIFYLVYNVDYKDFRDYYSQQNKLISEYNFKEAPANSLINFFKSLSDNEIIDKLVSSNTGAYKYVMLQYKARLVEQQKSFNELNKNLKNAKNDLQESWKLDKINRQVINNELDAYKKDLDLQKEFNAKLIRPLQDAYKALYYFQINDVKDFTWEILDNPLSLNLKPPGPTETFKSIHAELNIAFQFPFLPTDNKYIGVSRLCCANCDLILIKFALGHRGTHNIYIHEQLSKLPNIKQAEYFLQELKKLVKTGEANENTLYQYRRLSTDSIEEGIICVEEDEKAPEMINLLQFKKDLGLIEREEIEIFSEGIMYNVDHYPEIIGNINNWSNYYNKITSYCNIS